MSSGIKSELPLLTARLNAMAGKLKRPAAGVKAAGRAVQNVLTKHFRAKNQVLNKRGWRKSGFWKQVRDSVQMEAQELRCTVVINDPRFMQRLHGGTIRPKAGRSAIAIPLKPEFAGVNPSFFPRDKFILVKSKRGRSLGLLAEKLADGSLRICYVLRRSVDQAADPTALPELHVIEAAASAALQDRLAREMKNS